GVLSAMMVNRIERPFRGISGDTRLGEASQGVTKLDTKGGKCLGTYGCLTEFFMWMVCGGREHIFDRKISPSSPHLLPHSRRGTAARLSIDRKIGIRSENIISLFPQPWLQTKLSGK